MIRINEFYFPQVFSLRKADTAINRRALMEWDRKEKGYRKIPLHSKLKLLKNTNSCIKSNPFFTEWV